MNIILKSTSIHDFCRVCLKSSVQLFPCQTQMFFKDTSLTFIDILNTLSPHNVTDPTYYPNGICLTCKEFVQTSFVLKTTYEKTNQLLKTLFAGFKNKQQEKRTALIEIKDSSNEDTDDENFTNNGNEKVINKRVSRKDDIDELFCRERISEESEDNVNIENEEAVSKKTINRGTQISQNKEQQKINDGEYTSDRTKEKWSMRDIKISINHTSMKLKGKPLFEQNHLCPICRKQLPNPTELKQHTSGHKILRKYLQTGLKISEKTKFFAQPPDNITIFNKDKILHKCTFCKEENPIENFRSHVKEHFERGDFACNQCDRVFRKISHLNSHITFVHLEEMPYQCDKCDKGFKVKYSYDCHILTHENSPDKLPHKCDYCDKAYANKHHLKRHLFRHTDKRSYWTVYKINKCKICLRTFETNDELEQHHLSNCKPVPISLKRLPKKYFKKNGLPEPSSIKELCALCGARVINIKQHMKQKHESHNVLKELCALCGAIVLNIKQHMMGSHGPKMPVECNICHKKLSSKLTLAKHIRVHTGERPYPCKYCEKKFKDIHTRNVHQRTHEGIKRHFCPVCGKGFLEKAYVLKHLRGVHK